MPACVISLDDFEKIRWDLGIIVATSGGFDPLHPGHASSILDSKKYGDTLVVIVNGDWFLTNKKGRSFQDLMTRCKIVSYLRGVDYVVPFEIENDDSVCEALRRIRPHVFAKGGDRNDLSGLPEYKVCQDLGIKIQTGVGLDKEWSSTDFLTEWGQWWASNRISSS